MLTHFTSWVEENTAKCNASFSVLDTVNCFCGKNVIIKTKMSTNYTL